MTWGQASSLELCVGPQTRLKPVSFSSRISAATMDRPKRQNLWEPRVELNDRFQKVSWTGDRHNPRLNVHFGVTYGENRDIRGVGVARRQLRSSLLTPPSNFLTLSATISRGLSRTHHAIFVRPAFIPDGRFWSGSSLVTVKEYKHLLPVFYLQHPSSGPFL